MSWNHCAIAGLGLFTIGAAVGSFLNVCIYRLPIGQSLLHPPSSCPSCGRGLMWRDNLPVLGWIALRGRCRACGWRIPARYLMVELLTGLWFVAAWGIVAAVLGGDLLEAPAAAVLSGMLALQAAGCVTIIAGGIAWDRLRASRTSPASDSGTGR